MAVVLVLASVPGSPLAVVALVAPVLSPGPAESVVVQVAVQAGSLSGSLPAPGRVAPGRVAADIAEPA